MYLNQMNNDLGSYDLVKIKIKIKLFGALKKYRMDKCRMNK
jgi:hypothetical protein